MKKGILFLFLGFSSYLFGQNAAPNNDFEQFSSCPPNLGIFTALSWSVPTSGTSDYFNECGSPPSDIPSNTVGFQESATGDAYVGIASFASNIPNYREYVQAQFDTPLEAGCYELSIYYSNADQTSYSTGLGMYLSVGAPATYFNVGPQLELLTIIENKTDWFKISAQYFTTGGETHITLGNFNNDNNTTVIQSGGSLSEFCYQFIDSVAVDFISDNTPPIEVDLGADLEVCPDDFPIIIDSNYPTGIFVWNTGETGTSIEINGPGTYSITVVDNCAIGEDEIEVKLYEVPEISLEDESICEGESLTITLDSDLGTYTWPDGSNGPSYTFESPGTFEVSLEYECDIIYDEIEIDQIPLIPFPDVQDYEVCESDMPFIIDLTYLANEYNEFIWSDGTTLPAIVISEGDVYSIEVYNDCFVQVDYFTVTVVEELPLFIPYDGIVCEGVEVIINSGIEDADLVWQDGSTDPFYIADGPGEYILTATNICDEIVYEFEIEAPPEVEIDLGDDLDICPGDSVLLGSVTGDELMWNVGENASSIWVNSAGEYIASFEGTCVTVIDTIVISENGEAPVLVLSDSLLLCIGDTLFINASETPDGIDFQWNTGVDESEVEIFEGGNYVVIAENSCGTSIDSIFISEGEALPIVDIDDLTKICEGEMVVYNVEGENIDILWSTGSIEESVELQEDGQYWVNVSNSCAIISDTFDIEFIAPPEKPNVGDDESICEGDSVMLVAIDISDDYSWETGEEETSITVYEAGIYVFNTSNECGVNSDTIEVFNLGEAPSVDLGIDQLFCDGDTVFLSVGGSYNSIFWNVGSTESEIAITEGGEIAILVSNDCGLAADTVLIELNEEVPTADIGDDQEICPGDSVLIELTSAIGTIEWNTGSDAASIFAKEEGWYSVMLSSSCGDAWDSIYVSELPEVPEVELGNDTILCLFENLTIDLGLTDDVDILWSDGNADNVGDFIFPGTYWVEVSNSCGVSRDTIVLEFYPIIDLWSLPQDTLLCDANELNVGPDLELIDVTFSWNTGEEEAFISISETGDYSLTIGNECEERTEMIHVTFGESPNEFNLEAEDTICAGEQIFLDGNQGEDYSYEWQDGTLSSSYTITETGEYTLEVSNQCGSESASVDVAVLESVGFHVDVSGEYIICKEESVLIDLINSLADFVEWDDGSTEFIRDLSIGGDYSVHLFNECRDTIINLSVVETVCDLVQVYIPNVFTPNEDGINDFFTISYPSEWTVLKSEISIYNRWGERMYYSEESDFKWDGGFKGSRLNPGVYVYMFVLEVEVNGQKYRVEENGDVTLVR